MGIAALAALAAAGVAVSLCAAESGGEEALRRNFQSPQGAVRMNTGPLFWMHGTETEARLREYVGCVAESGQGILTIESRPHKDWMCDGWWRDVDIVIDECRRRGLKVLVFDDYWWPSQGMGGKYPIPEKFRSVDVNGVVYSRSDAPQSEMPGEICRISVNEMGSGAYRPCADGDKTIVYAAVPLETSRFPKFPTVNGLDEAAVDWFIANYYQPYYDRCRDAFEDGTIVGFFFDEPQFMSWWGDALAKELKARGEDVGELLTALKFRLADPEAQARALYSYHDARAETWGRTMYGRQSEWCRRHGVYSSGHLEEHGHRYYSPTKSCGNWMQQMKYVDVPGVDLVMNQYYPHDRQTPKKQIAFGQIPKCSSSAAHVYNRRGGLNWCEIFGGYGQELTYPQMKWLCDEHLYQGCYFLIPHSFNPKAPYDDDFPPYFYNGGCEPRYPLFRVWADYNNRCALLLSGGEHVCQIAQCVPGISYHIGKTIRPEMLSFAIQDAQLDSDWLGYDAVESARIEKNPRTDRPALRAENGKEHYDILTLPAAEYVPFAVLEKALVFARAGGVVVGYGVKPSDTPTRGKTAEDARRIVDAIFAQPTALFIDGEPDGAKLRAALAKNYPGESRPLAVREFDFEGLSDEDARMLAVNHCEKDGDIRLFIANQDANRGRCIAIRSKWPAERVELWDPMQGTVERPVVKNGLVMVPLAPSQAVFLVWPKMQGGKPPCRIEYLDGPAALVVDAAVAETVKTVDVDAKDSKKVTRSPYKESVETEMRFDLPAFNTGERVYFTCAGTEHEESAACEVNGVFAGGFIGAPYRLDITRFAKSGPNILAIKPFRIEDPRIVVVKPENPTR